MNGKFTNLMGLGVALVLCLLSTSAWINAQEVTDSTVLTGHAASWLHTNGNFSGHRYSAFTHMNPSDDQQLTVDWIFSRDSGPDTQNTLLYRDGNSAHENLVLGIDAQSGRRVWKHVYFLSGDGNLHTTHPRSAATKSSTINLIASGWRPLGDYHNIKMRSILQRSEDACKKCRCCGRRDKPLGNFPLAAASNDLNLAGW